MHLFFNVATKGHVMKLFTRMTLFRITFSTNSYFKPVVLSCSFIQIIFVTLLLLAMDIHQNPGPSRKGHRLGLPILHQDRQAGIGGGVAVYCHENLGVSLKPDLGGPNLHDASCLWIEIHNGQRSLLVGTFYRPPGQLAAVRDYFTQIYYISS